VVPEVQQPCHCRLYAKGIIANPNCSTIQMVVALYPNSPKYGIKRIVVSTYQRVSGTGQKAIVELDSQVRAIMNSQPVEISLSASHRIQLPFPISMCYLDNGYTKEEMKMVRETQKIMEDDTIGVTATTVRVPVFYSHSESINIETRLPITP